MTLAIHPWLRRLALLLFLAAVALTAQEAPPPPLPFEEGREFAIVAIKEPKPCTIQVWFSLLPYDAAASLYGKRVADRVSTWLASVAVADTCAGPQVVTEHDLSLAASGQNLQVISIASASLIMASEQKKNGWRRAGGIFKDVAMRLAAHELTGLDLLGPDGQVALGIALPLLDPIGERLIGVAPATVENYVQLLGQRILQIEPGAANAMHLWTAPATGPATRHAEIERK